MEIIKPPIFQAGFSPIILTCKGNVGDKVAITISPKNARDFSISSTLIKKEQTFNLAAYIQSLFNDASVYSLSDNGFTQALSYTLMVNGTPLEDTFYALRSAAQVGESTDMEAKLGSFLTDMNWIDVWQGYPEREVAILAKSGYSAQLIGGSKQQNIGLEGGLNTVSVGCENSEIVIYKDAALWQDYHCQLVENTYFFTVHVGDRTAKLSGTVSLSVATTDGNLYTKTESYSGFQDVSFEIPINDNIVEVSITANGALDTNSIQIISALQPYRECDIPTVTCTLPVSHTILSQNSNIHINKNSSRLLNITINQPIT